MILRAEILEDTDDRSTTKVEDQSGRGIAGAVPVRTIRRRLLPRRPGRDDPLEQVCTLYAADVNESPHAVVLTPIRADEKGDGDGLPYYHPKVHHLAFRYLKLSPSSAGEHTIQGDDESKAILRIDVDPLPNVDTDLDSRLYRTCLALLDALHRYAWGAKVDYQKRVLHDQIIPRELYQDTYLLMRARHKNLVGTWKESTDPLKHVFEVR